MNSSPPLPPEVRAKALRALLALTDGLGGVPMEDVWKLAVSQLNEREIAAMELAVDEDLALLNGCLQLEHDQREAEFAAVERLLALLPDACAESAGQGFTLDDRLRALAAPEFAQAAALLYVSGWIDYPAG